MNRTGIDVLCFPEPNSHAWGHCGSSINAGTGWPTPFGCPSRVVVVVVVVVAKSIAVLLCVLTMIASTRNTVSRDEVHHLL